MSGGLSFLAALFGGAYWGSKYSEDKAALKNARQEYDTVSLSDEAIRADWESKVINRALEAELEDKIYQSNPEVMTELEKTWGDYYTTDFPKLFIGSRIGSRLLDTDPNSFRGLTALRILLANRGFLTYHDATMGFNVFANGNTDYQRIENHKIQVHFIERVNRKLQSRGIDYPMYFEAVNHLYYPFPREYKIFSGSVFEVGTVKWKPEISSSLLQNSYRRLQEIGYFNEK